MAGTKTYRPYWNFTRQIEKEYKGMNLYVYLNLEGKMEVAKMIYNYLKKDFDIRINLIKFNGKFKRIAGRCSFDGYNGNKSVYRIELEKGTTYLIQFIDVVCHELAHTIYMGHNSHHLELTKKFIRIVIEELGKNIINIFKPEVNEPIKVAAKQKQNKIIKIQKTFITRGKNGDGMKIDFTFVGATQEELIETINKLVDFFNKNNMDVKYDRIGLEKCRITFQSFEEKYYQKLLKLYKEFKKTILKSN